MQHPQRMNSFIYYTTIIKAYIRKWVTQILTLTDKNGWTVSYHATYSDYLDKVKYPQRKKQVLK
ncbi:ancestral ankyrin repeat-containing protein orthologue [Wolbachia endosymbiont of Onchocerca ochengi]|nr:ancestral ankyrin repeat-containing protein orthologue [Wolbachia endosymbiont of Onchocerca ochengi]